MRWDVRQRIRTHAVAGNNRLWDRVTIGLLLSMAAVPAHPQTVTTFTVNDNGDASDAVPGDGVCATTTGVCTLRAAVEESSAALLTPHKIDVPAMTIRLRSPLIFKASYPGDGTYS